MSRTTNADLLLNAYARGIFPMAAAREDAELHWVDPRLRGIFPLDNFHVSRSLAQAIRRENYEIRTNTAFSEVVCLCASRSETWINATLAALYDELHAIGHAHSLEVWQDGELTGGVFGISLGGAFFGESMFSTRTDASKIALAFLIDRLTEGGFSLFDTQFLTPHLASLGAIEISRADYRKRLAEALRQDADFTVPETPPAQLLLQRRTQRS
ncbi:leucyl/phenylalanyl-tRNA--protein transferase [Defluviimonas sp. SAOS-178_SWC]|uniref:leucyl/phenylalanyl-tRNA--protein transferase n=1 Tax=Defluviimonas sp. SAOS-178_SWC TaxID=3121287 RepID=UPI003221825C